MEVSKVAETGERTGTTVSAMAATQDALHKTIVADDAEFTDQLAVALQNQQKIQTTLGQLQGGSHTLVDRIEAVVEAQSTLDETLHQATDQLTGRLMTLTSNHGQLHSNVNSLREVSQKVARHVVTIGEEMETLHGALEDNNQLLTRGAVAAEEKMEILGSEVKKVAEANQQTGAAVNLMAGEQMAMAKTVNSSREDLTRQIAELSEEQQTGIEEMKSVTAEVRKMAELNLHTDAAVNAVASGQVAMAKAIDGSREHLTEQIAELSEEQRTGIHELKSVAVEVTKMAEGNQRTGATVNAVAREQMAMVNALNGSKEDLTKQITALSENQEAGIDELKSVAAGVRRIAEDNQQTGATVNLMASEQMAMAKAVDGNREDLAKHVALLSKSQQDGVADLKAITAEVKKVAEASRQAGASVNAMAKALNTNREDLTEQISQFLESQQSGIDELKAMTGETASNLLLIDGKQAKLEQVFETHREKLVSALNAIAQGQQEWLKRLDMAREKTNAVVEGFRALEQRITQLQDNSQTDTQELAELLSTQGQLRMEFEAKISQGLQTITESIADIVGARASLQDQLEEVEKEVRPHTEDIAWAIEKLKQQSAATDDPSPTV